jgi:hypothetical protein
MKLQVNDVSVKFLGELLSPIQMEGPIVTLLRKRHNFWWVLTSNIRSGGKHLWMIIVTFHRQMLLKM